MAEGINFSGPQNSGNPVLDTLVNLVAGRHVDLETVRKVHALVLELAAQEPGGLKCPPGYLPASPTVEQMIAEVHGSVKDMIE